MASSLNEGRGRDPGDTWNHHHNKIWVPYRSTKAGAETPATRYDPPHRRIQIGARSTKAGAETPATPPAGPCDSATSYALNEGRGRDPGDTRSDHADDQATIGAQRRPGPRPRRHIEMGERAGGFQHAQRRPGPRPRRHPVLAPLELLVVRRSTKAGAETPATRVASRP